MNIRFTNSKTTPERESKIVDLLPKKTIIEDKLEPIIEAELFKTLAECIRQELEVYRAYPKDPAFSEEPEPVEKVLETFDPRNNETCFMGKGFKANGDSTDFELTRYRRAIGTIPHPIWGDCTLLEIWGGDHFEDYNEMVVGAFKYGMNLQETCPEIKVHINPLFQNKKSKTFKLSQAQQEEKDAQEMLFAKALIFGVRDAKESRKARGIRDPADDEDED